MVGSHPILTRRWSGMGELPPKVLKAVQTALQRARGWRRPPHWDCHQWQEELDAIAQASAFEACFRFDEQQGVPLEAFIFQQVLIALRDFHRREWAYFAICCGHLQRAHDAGEREEVEESMEVCGQGDGADGKGVAALLRFVVDEATERTGETGDQATVLG